MNIHFIGIGGIGVSALAKYYLEKGHNITGSDLVRTEITDWFEKKGVKVLIGKNRAENVANNIDLVVYSPAVEEDNPELKFAKDSGVKTQSYPQALGDLTKKHFTIAITGTHGKSTTTSMTGLLLMKAGLDPTVIVGTKLKEFEDSSCRVGKSKYLVIEACEHFESFLNYYPNIIVLTTIEAEHLDYYKNLDGVLKGFKKFVNNLEDNGVIIANRDDENTKKIIENATWYSLKDKEAVRIKEILQVPGDFNISNALAALNVARALKIPDEVSFKVLSEYKGSWRRFEISEIALNGKQITLIDDYGHHPTEIKVTLKAARERFPKKQIWCVFQPHQYQRTYYLLDDFIDVFKQAPVDKLIITDIYDVAGREEKEIREKINSEKLVNSVNKNSIVYIQKEKIIDFLNQNLNGGEIVIIMGAGDIYDDVSLELKKQK
ncbi:MAG: UDP-N-acetylmuramate--L-alanine ligase [Candidatus Nealsonbacteria bacterium]